MKTLKKIAVILALVGGITSLNAQFSIGGGFGYNEGIDAPGVTVKAEFEIMENIAISPSVSYFSGSEARLVGTAYKNNLFAVDINGLYKIEVMMDELDVYPLAGLNYSSYKNGANVVFDGERFSQASGNDLGLNVGGGGRWHFSEKLSAIAEIKYTISGFSQLVAGVGVLYQL